MKNIFTLIIFLLVCSNMNAQDEETQYVSRTFRGTRIVNGHSVEMQKKGELDLIIAHRFGAVNGKFYTFFGLDQASMRWGLEYGWNDWLVTGFGRSNVEKKYDVFVKAKIMTQTSKGKFRPVSLTWFSNSTVNTIEGIESEPTILLQSRLSFTHQLLIARKFNERFSAQLTPTVVHRNLVSSPLVSNDVYALGVAGKFQITKNWAITSEYYFVMPDQLADDKINSLSVGFDINTGSHVFQLHFSNSQGMIEDQFIAKTTDDWLDGGIHIGFNMIRTFKIKGRRY